MRYISIFSGIEAASVAWEPLGWEPVAFSEIDEFPSAVLRKRYPDVPNLGDITKVDWSPYRGAVDLVVGGSPCQSFSIAGKREGLSGASGLMWEYVRCIQEVVPDWLIWENVPGAFSVERGGAFKQLLESLDGLGYGLAWRVLDAQFVRVPERDDSGAITRWVGPVAQRRRRVFLVGHLGDMRACEVLFEPESLRWNTPSSREKRKALAADARRGAQGAGECLTPWDVQSKRVYEPQACGPTLPSGTTEGMNIQPSVLTYSLQTEHTAGNGSGVSDSETRYTVSTSTDQAVAFAQNTRDEVRIQGDGTISGALAAQPGMKQQTYIAEPLVMASAHANAEIGAGGGDAHPDGAHRQAAARTSNGDDVFPSLCATDGSKQFIDNQSVRGGRLIIQPGDSDGGRQREGVGGHGDVRLPQGRGGAADGCVPSNGEDVIGALCARDYKGVGSQYVSEGKVVLCPNR